jgi:ribosomal protein S27AE
MDNHKKTCPKCGSPKIKSWPELTDEQKMLVKSLPASTEYPLSQRKKHRFCTRCWFENFDQDQIIA